MSQYNRRISKIVTVGKLPIGGGFPVSVQSMTTPHTADIAAIKRQIHDLETAGCQLIRVTVSDEAAARALPEIRKAMTVPLVADIHFDYRLALKAIDAGVDKIRINPGNIGNKERIQAVLKAARSAKIPIRIGVNAGSLEKELLEKYGHPNAEAMVASAARHIQICEDFGFEDIIVALKASNVSLMIAANRLFTEKYDYPLHLGVTEAGPPWQGTIKSAIGIGTLLAEGIGDTIRVSLTDDPVQEVQTGFEILKSLDLIKKGITIISCPTCGRADVDIIGIVADLESRVKHIQQPMTVAVMGCAVNGPGEAREADLGVAGGKKSFLLFKKGEIIAKIPESQVVDRLLEEIKRLSESKEEIS
ncbi:flavodoxin-dependent (E)-4-hydroxy-3-methylbut-2-enyl-diphosphate synthase [bacterium]|nr:flavodoxin-dependent (E)-4-hydroxy-3-methylbut-2-enyl-diphosphate synthase [bacterium]MBU1633823.1 flavodoxin-dependent (E)-4-hydroxy-3-methylbut-2-enyl-diphosphate synthase [bacterium]MBU1872910.1 flavodoxin-dependent (E)-4-hydroxy-3-methylbut-2-enyl-diphosphate synthase [bacterium]